MNNAALQQSQLLKQAIGSGITRTILPDVSAQLLTLLEETFELRAWCVDKHPSLKRLPDELLSDALTEPLADFLARGGKSFRARFTLNCWQAAGGNPPFPRELPLIVEVLHAGSLIVDDIEDGAYERRGAPALHRTHGVPKALNAGNWLYFWPGVIIERMGLAEGQQLAIHRRISKTMLECHNGQALDLSVNVATLKQQEVSDVVNAIMRMKTGSLLGLAGALGAICAETNDAAIEAYSALGSDIGQGLQMMDDLSAIRNDKRAEKAKEDLCQGRATWVWAWVASLLPPPVFKGLQHMSEDVQAGALDYTVLRDALRMAVAPQAERTVLGHLDMAMEGITPHLKSAEAYARFTADLNRLVASYE